MAGATGQKAPATGTPKREVVAAFFDVDETVIRGSSANQVAKELYRRKFFGWRDIFFAIRHTALYLLFGENKNRLAAVKERALNVMAGHRVEEVNAIGESVYQEILGLRIFPGANRLVKKHLECGHEVWLISATPVEIVERIAEHLGATGGLGTIVARKDGRYLARLEGEMLHAKGKADRIESLAKERGINLRRSFAYSDSINDLPMLSMVGHPRVINPEPALRMHAMLHDWPVIDFRRRKRNLTKLAKQSALIMGVGSVALAIFKLIRRFTWHI